MKKTISVFILFFFLAITHAQNPYEITEQTIPYDKMATSFTANIIGQNESNVYYPW